MGVHSWVGIWGESSFWLQRFCPSFSEQPGDVWSQGREGFQWPQLPSGVRPIYTHELPLNDGKSQE